jgi:hypothetical protein
MALPKQVTTVYNTTIPSTDQKIKFKPFLIKEHKALLMAQQSEDQKVMVDTLKEVARSCIMDKVDIDSLAIFDLQYLLLQIRAKSVGEMVDLIFSCDTCIDDKAKVKINFDLTKMEVTKNPEHNKKIKLYDETGMVLKYPNLDNITAFDQLDPDDIGGIFNLIIDSIDYIYQGNETYYAKEQTREDLTEFLDNLTSDQFASIVKFYETMPRLRQDVKYRCPVCMKEHNKYIEGIETFF